MPRPRIPDVDSKIFEYIWAASLTTPAAIAETVDIRPGEFAVRHKINRSIATRYFQRIGLTKNMELESALHAAHNFFGVFHQPKESSLVVARWIERHRNKSRATHIRSLRPGAKTDKVESHVPKKLPRKARELVKRLLSEN